MHKSMHIKKTIIVSSQSEMIISIHYLVDNIFNDRDYLFESNETELILYAHLMNTFIEVILVRNDDKQVVKISRNYRLDYFIEFDYSNAFFVNDDNADLVMKASRITYLQNLVIQKDYRHFRHDVSRYHCRRYVSSINHHCYLVSDTHRVDFVSDQR